MLRVSIVIPVYNRASLTRACLDALLARPPRSADCEIIVIDDASTDHTGEVLAAYGDRIRTIRHETNRGFATSCNDGAAAASGQHIVFLNNDILPEDGWLDALVAYAERHPAAAAVGSKLLFPDRTIQHAGVVVCQQDRYPRHIYRGFPSDHPAVNRSRRFQIVTAACMLVRRDVFEQAGGFDTAFINGYEDVDLCLRLGELGHEIHYCHTSTLVHFESATRSGQSDEIKHNTRLYRERWRDRVRPDELEQYAEDGLLDLRYPHQDLYPLELHVVPELAVLVTADRGLEADRLLTERARQVWQLTLDNSRLRVELQDLADRLAMGNDDDAIGAVPALFGATLVSPQKLRQEITLLRDCVAKLLLTADPSSVGGPAGRFGQLLARKQRPIRFMPESAEGVTSTVPEPHAIWLLGIPSRALTLRAELAPGRYVVRLRAVAFEAARLLLAVDGEQARTIARLGPRCVGVEARFAIETPRTALRLSLVDGASDALLGDVSVWLEVPETLPQRVWRKLVDRAGRSDWIERLVRSRLGRRVRL